MATITSNSAALLAACSLLTLPAISAVRLSEGISKSDADKASDASSWIKSHTPGIKRIAMIPDPEPSGGFIKFTERSIADFKEQLRKEFREVSYQQMQQILCYLDPKLLEASQNRINRELRNPASGITIDFNGPLSDQMFDLMLGGMSDLKTPRFRISIEPQPKTGDSYLVISPEKRFVAGNLGDPLNSYALWLSQVDTLSICGAKVTVINGASSSGTPGEVWSKDYAYTNPNNGITYSYTGTEPVWEAKARDGDKLFYETPHTDIQNLRGHLEDLAIKVDGFQSMYVDFGQVHYDRQKNILFVGAYNEIDPLWFQNKCEKLKIEIGHNSAEAVGISLSRPPEGTLRANWFYHFDCCVAPLPATNISPASVLMAADGLTAESRGKIEAIYGKENIIHLPLEEGLRLATNVRIVGSYVLSPYLSDASCKQLIARGYKPVTPARLGITGEHLENRLTDGNDSPWKISNAAISCATFKLPDEPPLNSGQKSP